MRPIISIGRADSLSPTRSFALACVLVCGCIGEATTDDSHLTARERWTQQAWPALGTCVGCHGTQPSIDFFAPGTVDDAYTTVFEFQPPVIDVDAPASSLLLTMGKHTGPALDPQAAAQVLAWLEAERDERVPELGDAVRVGPFLPALGSSMTVDLGIAGATLQVFAEQGEAGLYMSKLTLNAGAGVRVVHPLFVSRPPNPVLDEIDRFADVDMTLGSSSTIELGPAAFLSFNPADYLTIHFKTLEVP